MVQAKDPISGVAGQVSPDIEQVVGSEYQIPTTVGTPPPTIKEPEKRILPLPGIAPPSTVTQVTTVAGEVVEVAAYPAASQPILRLNRYTGVHTEWQILVQWDIPEGYVGDLHEMAVSSSNDEKTRYAIIIGNINQNLPTDRQTVTPATFPWRSNDVPGGTSVYIAVLSTDGTSITVDGSITGTERLVPVS